MESDKEQARWLIKCVSDGRMTGGMAAEIEDYCFARRTELEKLTAERDHLRILYNTARDGMREVGELLETCRIELAESRAEVERLRANYEQLTALCKATEERERTALTTAAGLRRALEEVRCRCSRGIDNHCPECGDDLDRVVNNGPLNDDQFDAVKAGDWYCKKCKSDAAATGFKYWLDRQLPVVVYQTCDRCAALAATSDEHERRIKAEAYREAARRILDDPRRWPTVICNHIAHDLCAEADRLEAANGKA